VALAHWGLLRQKKKIKLSSLKYFMPQHILGRQAKVSSLIIMI
jgi:hypothetical protein